MPKILFVCTGNIYRSPLAAAFFVRKLRENKKLKGWVVESAGTWTVPGQSIPQDVLLITEKLGLDLKEHRSRLVNADLLAAQDLILVMERGHKEALGIEFPLVRQKTYLLSEVAGQDVYDIPDPMKSRQKNDTLAADISNLMDRGYQKIIRLAKKSPPR